MTTLPLADARARLSELVAEAQTTHERYEITRNGRPAAVLVAADDYEAMRETIAVLADSDLMQAVQEGLAQLHTGDALDEDQLAEYLGRAGRG
jgi:prevent-host-death family protein